MASCLLTQWAEAVERYLGTINIATELLDEAILCVVQGHQDYNVMQGQRENTVQGRWDKEKRKELLSFNGEQVEDRDAKTYERANNVWVKSLQKFTLFCRESE